MQAEDKLAEANYFLEKLRDSKEVEFRFNLSAFIQAWRSVFDVLLYDYAEKYFKYSAERNIKTNKHKFKDIADVLENRGDSEPKKFIEWYEKKEKILRESPFWNLRIIFVHRGGAKGNLKRPVQVIIPVEVYVPPSAISAGTVPPKFVYRRGKRMQVKTEEELFIARMREIEIRRECKKVFLLMKEIVEEARKSFK